MTGLLIQEMSPQPGGSEGSRRNGTFSGDYPGSRHRAAKRQFGEWEAGLEQGLVVNTVRRTASQYLPWCLAHVKRKRCRSTRRRIASGGQARS